MKITKPLVIGGITMVVLGLIFHLQGHSMIGPPTSFMYANSDWIDYGMRILIIGVIVIGIGLALRPFQKH